MAGSAARRPVIDRSLYVLALAWFAVKPRTVEEAQACNAQFTRTRDFLMNEPARDSAVGGVSVTAEEFERDREAAIEQLRARCRTCGLCAQTGLKPP